MYCSGNQPTPKSAKSSPTPFNEEHLLHCLLTLPNTGCCYSGLFQWWHPCHICSAAACLHAVLCSLDPSGISLTAQPIVLIPPILPQRSLRTRTVICCTKPYHIYLVVHHCQLQSFYLVVHHCQLQSLDNHSIHTISQRCVGTSWMKNSISNKCTSSVV